MTGTRISQNKQKSTKLKQVLIFFALIVILLLGGIFTAVNWYHSSLKLDIESPVIFTVNEGDNFTSVIDRLEKQEIVRSKTAVQIYLRLNSLNPQIKAGDFILQPGMSIESLITALNQAPIKKGIFVTLKEGLRYEQMSDELETKLGEITDFSKATFEDIAENPDNYSFSPRISEFLSKYKPAGNSLRGFLFPDTYRFDEGITELEIIEIMLGNFIDKVGAKVNFDSDYLNSGNFESFYDALILASIIEKEASAKDKKEDISSVFHNRMNIGMSLDSDATINFFTGKNDSGVAFVDRDTQSPYNTYLNVGLPPTPINNPSLGSIIAALNPSETEFFYFYHTPDGQGHFSKDFSSHSAGVCRDLGC
ncbi:MAG: endolytic transglycosylase MltG [Candidatus Dojkabacteria bacterium]